jgi:polysaccharide pyruvyl transferase WcaK-like protein
MTRAPRIFILANAGGGNFGNDASLEAALLWVRASIPGAEVTAVCTEPSEVTRRYSAPGVRIRVFPRSIPRWLDTLLLRQPSLWLNWHACLRALRGCDVLMVAGTGAIHDYRDRPWGWPSRFLRWILAAKLSGVPVAMICVGAGPVINPLSRAMMKWSAQLASRRFYRDEDSRAYMASLGVDERESIVACDLTFLLPTPPAPSRAGAAIVVGVGLMNYRGWRRNEAIYRRYIEQMAQLFEWLKSNGYGWRVLIGQTPTDLVAVDDVEARLGYEVMSAEDRRMESFQDVMDAVAATDVVVASRYHVQIAALKHRVPVVSLSYGPMNDALMQAAGLSQFCEQIERFDSAALAKQCQRLIEARTHYAALVNQKVSAMETALPRQLQALLDWSGRRR